MSKFEKPGSIKDARSLATFFYDRTGWDLDTLIFDDDNERFEVRDFPIINKGTSITNPTSWDEVYSVLLGLSGVKTETPEVYLYPSNPQEIGFDISPPNPPSLKQYIKDVATWIWLYDRREQVKGSPAASSINAAWTTLEYLLNLDALDPSGDIGDYDVDPDTLFTLIRRGTLKDGYEEEQCLRVSVRDKLCEITDALDGIQIRHARNIIMEQCFGYCLPEDYREPADELIEQLADSIRLLLRIIMGDVHSCDPVTGTQNPWIVEARQVLDKVNRLKIEEAVFWNKFYNPEGY